MATHSSVLAWRIPGTGEPGGLPSVGLQRVGHDGSDLAAAAAALKLPERDTLSPASVGTPKCRSRKCSVASDGLRVDRTRLLRVSRWESSSRLRSGGGRAGWRPWGLDGPRELWCAPGSGAGSWLWPLVLL